MTSCFHRFFKEEPVANSNREGFAIWLTGMPSAGKSTVAMLLHARLARRKITTQILDSSDLRNRLMPDFGPSPQDRDRFYAIVADVAAVLTARGVNVIIAATGPLRRHRDAARSKIARFAEVHLDCDPRICRERNPKRLWRLGESGAITAVSNRGFPYEWPLEPDARVDTSFLCAAEAALQIERQLEAKTFFHEAWEWAGRTASSL